MEANSDHTKGLQCVKNSYASMAEYLGILEPLRVRVVPEGSSGVSYVADIIPLEEMKEITKNFSSDALMGEGLACGSSIWCTEKWQEMCGKDARL
jgi:hypothetical protein